MLSNHREEDLRAGVQFAEGWSEISRECKGRRFCCSQFTKMRCVTKCFNVVNRSEVTQEE